MRICALLLIFAATAAPSPGDAQSSSSQQTARWSIAAFAGAGGGTTPNVVLGGSLGLAVTGNTRIIAVAARWFAGIAPCDAVVPSSCATDGRAVLAELDHSWNMSSRVEVFGGIAAGAYIHGPSNSHFSGTDRTLSARAGLRVGNRTHRGIGAQLSNRYLRVLGGEFADTFNRPLHYAVLELTADYRW